MNMDVKQTKTPVPWQKQIRVPLLCMCTGALSYAASRILAGAVSQDTAFIIGSVFALVLFLLSGFLFLRRLHQNEIVRSAGYMVLYYFLVFVVAQEVAARGNTLPQWVLLPVWPFTYLHTGLLRVGFPRMFALAPALLFPLFYAMFGRPRMVEGDDHIAAPAKSKELDVPDIQGGDEKAQEPKD